MSYILGINGGFRPGYQDVSAVLLNNGEIVAAIEEERLSRIKFSAGKLPYLSIFEVLKIGKITIREVETLAFHGSTWGNEVEEKIIAYFENHFGYCPPVKRYHHHDCHAISSYIMSGFKQALSVSLDNSGDGVSLQVSVIEKNKIETVYRSSRPNSLGIFYSLITQYTGFTRDSDEYKLMGLSSYGDRNAIDFSWLIEVTNHKLVLNDRYIQPLLPNQPGSHRDEMLYNPEFIRKMGRGKRLPDEPMDSYYQDVAASAQKQFEDCLKSIILYYIENTGIDTVCLSGGAALNCVANQKIMNLPEVKDIFIQPAASDAGVSMGAAWLACIEQNITPVQNQNTYLGPSYSDHQIKQTLDLCKVPYTLIQHPELVAAQLISENKVIGWFQGAMEFGPRALGNRSILANPCNPDIKNIINHKIKFRESFRPFCPSVLEEDIPLYFSGNSRCSPYMTITFDANEYAQESLPSVVHIDNTARIQTVNGKDNPIFCKLLKELKRINNHGVVLNTSFNLSHEPIVCTPRDAIATFYSSGIDALIIGNYLLVK